MCVFVSEDNLGCWSLPSTLFETVSVVCPLCETSKCLGIILYPPPIPLWKCLFYKDYAYLSFMSLLGI